MVSPLSGALGSAASATGTALCASADDAGAGLESSPARSTCEASLLRSWDTSRLRTRTLLNRRKDSLHLSDDAASDGVGGAGAGISRSQATLDSDCDAGKGFTISEADVARIAEDATRAAAKESCPARAFWRKQVPILYDVLLAHHCPWQHITALSWLPGIEEANGAVVQRLAVACSGYRGGLALEADYAVLVLAVRTCCDVSDGASGNTRESLTITPGITVSQRMPLDHFVEQVAVNQSRPHLAATRAAGGDALVFDLSQQEYSQGLQSKPLLRLRHTEAVPRSRLPGSDSAGGRGVAWSPTDASRLAIVTPRAPDGNASVVGPGLVAPSAAVCIWDVQAKKKTAVLQGRQDHADVQAVAFLGDDVSVGPSDTKSLLVAGRADGCVQIWDIRAPRRAAASAQAHATSCDHISVLQSGTCSGLASGCIASGGAEDHLVRLWDPRRLTSNSISDVAGRASLLNLPLWSVGGDASANGCNAGCSGLSCSSMRPGVVATMCNRGRVLLWDLTRPTSEQNGICNDVFFAHGGHMSKLGSDAANSAAAPVHGFGGLAWSGDESGLIASAWSAVDKNRGGRSISVTKRRRTDLVSPIDTYAEVQLWCPAAAMTSPPQ